MLHDSSVQLVGYVLSKNVISWLHYVLCVLLYTLHRRSC